MWEKNNIKKIILLFVFIINNLLLFGQINFGSRYDLPSANTNGWARTELNSNKFIVVYYDATITSTIAKIGTISGTEITYGSNYTISYTDGTDGISVTKLQDDAVAIAINEGAANGRICLCTISGTSISISRSLTTFQTGSVGSIIVEALTNTSFVLFYRTTTGNHRIVSTNSTYTSTTLNTVYSSSAFYGNIFIKKINSTSYLTFSNNSSSYLYARVCSISGTAITFNTSTQVTTSQYASNCAACILSETEFILTYDVSYAYSVVGTISGTSISFGTRLYVQGVNSMYPLFINNKILLFGNSYVTDIIKNGTTLTVNYQLSYPSSFSNNYYFYPYYLTNSYFLLGYFTSTPICGFIIGELQSGKKINGITYSKWNGTAITKFNNQ